MTVNSRARAPDFEIRLGPVDGRSRHLRRCPARPLLRLCARGDP